jgi:alkaline phosphatase
VDKQVPDSAGTATAYLCGVKANFGTIGVTAAVKRGNCTANADTANHVNSALYWAQLAGKSTGFITTTRVTHATPSGLYAHIADRNWESDSFMAEYKNCTVKDIARQLIEDEPGRNIQVILGGGYKEFLSRAEGVPRDERNRTDGRDLISEWIQDKKNRNLPSAHVTTAKELLRVDTTKTDYLFGLFSADHLHYEVDRMNNSTQPTLKEMVEVAIRVLSKNPKGFFLLIEGGRIDMAHHDGFAKRALEETVMLSSAVTSSLSMTNIDDTLTIVTADHSHVMTINGYPERGNDILGIASATEQPVPNINYTTLMYNNGPGFRLPPPNGTGINITGADTTHKDFKQLAAVPVASETHGGDDVAVYATGPRAHLLRGVIEQNYIAHAISYAACVGPSADLCAEPPDTPRTIPPQARSQLNSADRLSAHHLTPLAVSLCWLSFYSSSAFLSRLSL